MSESLKTPNPESGPLYAPETGFSLFIKLFIVPAVIVLVALGIFFLGTMALQHPKTAEQYLEELKSDNTSRRWQSAYELSRMLNQNEDIQFDPNLRTQLVQVFGDAKNDDPRLREYLALVLGRLKEKSAVSVLSAAVREDGTDVKVYSLWALGNIEDPQGGEAALDALSESDATVQRMAVGALSAMRYEPAKFALEKNLDSVNPALRYDSAVALARLKDEKAMPTLLEMMNLKPSGKPEDDGMIQSAKITAIEGAKELPDAVLKDKIVDLSKNESDIKVRETALAALKNSSPQRLRDTVKP
jgi:HEAT repeat protein